MEKDMRKNKTTPKSTLQYHWKKDQSEPED